MEDTKASTAVAPAALVAGKYRLSRLLGRGGMGSVWEGVHTTLGTRVAVKFIDAEHVESVEARRRFENEARAAAQLRSKHVVEVYDHGMMDDGRPFIVMEYLDGEPLDRRLDRLGRLTARDTARVVTMVCRALAKAHAAGIVHRDLKPENVFLVWDDEDGADVAKVVDFGIAKFTEADGPVSATRTGSVLGTPYYMSPEQARGLRTVDHRSDLWSVGVIVYRCLTGHLPFEGEAVGDVLVKLCTAPLPLASGFASDLPPATDQWLERALAREPRERFQTAIELGSSLAVVCGLSLPSHQSGEVSLVGLGSGQHAAPALTPYSRTTPSAEVAARGSANTAAPISHTPAPETRAPASRGQKIGLWAAVGLAVAAAGAVALAFGLSGGQSDEPVGPKVVVAPAAPSPTPEPVLAPEPPPAPPIPSAAPSTAANLTAEPETPKQPPISVKPASPKPRPATRPAAKPSPKPAESATKAFIRPGHDIGF